MIFGYDLIKIKSGKRVLLMHEYINQMLNNNNIILAMLDSLNVRNREGYM